jgi:hypothetical protein
VLADAAVNTSASRRGAYELHIGGVMIATWVSDTVANARTWASNTVASADTGSVGRSASEAGGVAKRWGPVRSEAGQRSVAGATTATAIGRASGRRVGLARLTRRRRGCAKSWRPIS